MEDYVLFERFFSRKNIDIITGKKVFIRYRVTNLYNYKILILAFSFDLKF